MTDPLGRLVKHIGQVRYEDLPAPTVEVVKKAIIDIAGCSIAGSGAPLGRAVADMVKGWGGKKESRIYAYGYKAPVHEAAYANAIMARCLELDDVHEGTKQRKGGHGGHINVSIVPPALAVLENSSVPISGKKLILAVAVAGDFLVRIRLAAGEMGRVGWVTETLSPFAVVAALAKLLDLSEEVTTNAIGPAYAHCSSNVLSSSDGSWDMWLGAGLGARGGILAVDLARRGHQGAKSPFLGFTGLYPLYFRNEYHEETLLSGLGTQFESGNVSIKPYSCCKLAHHAIYTALKLIGKHNIKPEQIERIHVVVSTYQKTYIGVDAKGEYKTSPQSLGEAQFSLPITLAAAIIKGTVFPDVFTDATVKDEEIVSLARKVTLEVTPEKDEIMRKEGYPPNDVEIYLKGGKVFKGCEPFVIGNPNNPMSYEQVAEKLKRCNGLAAKRISGAKLDSFVEQITRLEELPDARPIVENLS